MEIKDSDWLIFLCFMFYALCKNLCFGLESGHGRDLA